MAGEDEAVLKIEIEGGDESSSSGPRDPTKQENVEQGIFQRHSEILSQVGRQLGRHVPGGTYFIKAIDALNASRSAADPVEEASEATASAEPSKVAIRPATPSTEPVLAEVRPVVSPTEPVKAEIIPAPPRVEPAKAEISPAPPTEPVKAEISPPAPPPRVEPVVPVGPTKAEEPPTKERPQKSVFGEHKETVAEIGRQLGRLVPGGTHFIRAMDLLAPEKPAAKPVEAAAEPEATITPRPEALRGIRPAATQAASQFAGLPGAMGRAAARTANPFAEMTGAMGRAGPHPRQARDVPAVERLWASRTGATIDPTERVPLPVPKPVDPVAAGMGTAAAPATAAAGGGGGGGVGGAAAAAASGGASGPIASALKNPALLKVAALTAVVTGAIIAFKKLIDVISEASESVAPFSARIQVARAMIEINRIHQRIQMAQRFGGRFAEFEAQKGATALEFEGLKTDFAGAMGPYAEKIMDNLQTVIELARLGMPVLEALVKLNDVVDDWINPLTLTTKAMDKIKELLGIVADNTSPEKLSEPQQLSALFGLEEEIALPIPAQQGRGGRPPFRP